MSCWSAINCTVVGYSENSGVQALAENWNGISWSIQPQPNPPAEDSTLFGVSCPTATDCTAVGEFESSSETLSEQWNGNSWAVQSTPNPLGATRSQLIGTSCWSASAAGDYNNNSARA